jgi:hypothetical protein
MKVTVNMPDQLARQWGDTPEAVGRHVIEDAAIEGYRAARISHRQVGELFGLDYWQAETFLEERGVPVNYSSADLTPITRRWTKSRSWFCLGHFAAALPHSLWRG